MLGMATLAGTEEPKLAGSALAPAAVTGAVGGIGGIGMPPMKGFIIGIM